MEWQHYNKLGSSMWYIEKLTCEMESALSGNQSVYEAIDVDLTSEQVASILKEIAEIQRILEDAKSSFGLKSRP